MKHLFPAWDLKRGSHAHDESGACKTVAHGGLPLSSLVTNVVICSVLCVQEAGAITSVARSAWLPSSMQLPFILLPEAIIVFDNQAGDCCMVKWGRRTSKLYWSSYNQRKWCISTGEQELDKQMLPEGFFLHFLFPPRLKVLLRALEQCRMFLVNILS